jgi:endonuclease V-like protein UPF0215 family
VNLEALLQRGKQIRVLGFDDGPGDPAVPVAGVVCSNTTMEGLVWGELQRDGLDATDVLARLVVDSKYAEQLHLVLTDGITMGGLNVLDLAALNQALGVPCVAVMRRLPNLERFRAAIGRVHHPEVRAQRMEAAGPLHDWEGGAFQVVGCAPEPTRRALESLTREGRVPECLRLAHLITGAVATGQSGKRA